MTLLKRDRLPRILYLGCVPIERSYHGSLLLYRLFEQWPADSLLVIEGMLGPSSPERRLQGVRYRPLMRSPSRLLRTRFSSCVSAALSLGAVRLAARAERLSWDYQPDAVVTVMYGFSWMTAAAVARRRGCPLHVIAHDDWPRVAPLGPLAARMGDAAYRKQDAVYGKVYRQAATRLCISPAMSEEYRLRYGVEAVTLYPTRAPGPAPVGTMPTRSRSRDDLTIAYAGSISSPGYAAPLSRLARILAKMGGRLALYGPLTQAGLGKLGLVADNIIARGLVDPPQLIGELQREADILFLPMSFAEHDRDNMRLSFPSKLADYTSVGLPIVVYGPEYCSAVRWARENPGAAEVVTREDDELLEAAVARIVDDPCLRKRSIATAGYAGTRDFSHAAGFARFLEALSCF